MGLTLWIVPSPTDADRLRNIMRPPEDRTGLSPSSYPKFDPHITLAALPNPPPVDIETLCKAVPVTGKPLPVRFKALSKADVYFRSVFLTIELTPAVQEIHQEVHQKLQLEPRTPLYPHLSLAYIDDKDADNGERDRFYEKLEPRTKTQLVDEAFSINVADNDAEPDWMGGFDCTEILAVECTGPIETWSIKQRISLV